METKIKELIAIGASVTANCVPCLRFHFQQARKAGATPDEIQKAVGVGRMVRKGAANTWDEEAESLLGAVDSSGSTGIKDQAEKVCGES
jgi:AhpD family alkylhydroperoxidase